MKMYILVRDDVPLRVRDGRGRTRLALLLPEIPAHTRDQFLAVWAVFKAVCKVNAKEFENAKSVPDHVVLTESALGNQEVALAFCPREEWPKMFRFFKLYRDVGS